MLSLFPRDVLDEVWDLIEIVSEGFLTYFFNTYGCASVLLFLTFLFLFVFLRRNLNKTMALGKCFCRTLTLINRYAGVKYRKDDGTNLATADTPGILFKQQIWLPCVAIIHNYRVFA